MTVLSDYVARMVECGMGQDDAMQIAAELFAAGVASSSHRKSVGAARTERWRQRHKASQCDGHEAQSDGVTKRHKASQSVTSDAPPISIESKKEETKKKREIARASQLPADWRPSPERWAEAVMLLGSDERAELELKKFRNHAAEKGRTSKRWDQAWANWVINAVQYGARNGFNGNRTSQVTDQSRTATIIAGVAETAERRYGGGGHPRIPAEAEPSGEHDPQSFGSGRSAA